MTHPLADNNLPPGAWLDRQARQAPLQQALLGEQVLTFTQLAERAEVLASALSDAGVQHDSVLGLQLADRWRFAQLFHAGLWLGVTLLPLDPAMPMERRDRLLRRAGCRYLVTEGTVPPGVTALPPGTLGFPTPPNPLPASPLSGDTPQLLIATSGSTGEPKGVVLSADNLRASVAAAVDRLELQTTDSWLACLPLFHIGGAAILLRCLAVGARVLLPPGFEAAAVWARIAAGEVSHISLVPAMLARLLEVAADQRPHRRLRVVLVGGGPLSPALAQRAHALGWPICVSYGMSETGSQCATDCGPQAGLEPGAVGWPLAGFELRITEAGRIQVRGPAVMRGYLSAGMAVDGLIGDWLETGDLGVLDTEGRLRVLGRADDQLTSGGKTLHPAEVEGLLRAHPQIGEVAVTGVPDATWGVRLVALYTGEVPPDELADWARQALPSDRRPRRYLPVTALPLNAMGKLQRDELARLLASVTDQEQDGVAG